MFKFYIVEKCQNYYSWQEFDSKEFILPKCKNIVTVLHP